MNQEPKPLAYEVVEAKTHEEAVEKSSYVVGGAGIITNIDTTPNSDGTFTVIAIYAPLVKRKKP